MALFGSKKVEVVTPVSAPTPFKVEVKAKPDGKAVHEIRDVGPKKVAVTVKWFNGAHGFVVGPDGDAHVHESALIMGVTGKRVHPKEGSDAMALIGRGFKDGKDMGPAVSRLTDYEPYIPRA